MSDEEPSKKAKVLDFRSRRPVEEVQAEREAEAKKNADLVTQYEEIVSSELQQALIQTAEDLLKLAKSGQLDGIIVAGRHQKTGFFYTDIAFGPEGCSPQAAKSWVGTLEELKTEMLDVAMMAPCLLPDGEISFPPMIHMEEDDE